VSEEYCWVITQTGGAVMLRPIKLQHAGIWISAGPLRTCRLAIGWTVRGSNPGGGEIFRTCPDRPWGPTQPPVQWVPCLSRG